MTDRMTNAEIEALCERLTLMADQSDMGRKPDPTSAIRQALTAIRQLQNPWMPIETAPRVEDDCTTILLLCHTNNDDYHANIYVGFWGQLSPENDRLGWCDWGAGINENLDCWQEVRFATHWQPLPPAPEMGE